MLKLSQRTRDFSSTAYVCLVVVSLAMPLWFWSHHLAVIVCVVMLVFLEFDPKILCIALIALHISYFSLRVILLVVVVSKNERCLLHRVCMLGGCFLGHALVVSVALSCRHCVWSIVAVYGAARFLVLGWFWVSDEAYKCVNLCGLLAVLDCCSILQNEQL